MDHDTYDDDYIRDILESVRTIALVGASATPVRPSYFAMKYMQAKGYKVIPVNPKKAGKMLLDEMCYASLSDIPEPVDMVDIFRNSEAAGAISDESVTIKAKVVWMQLGVRNDAAAVRAEAAGCKVVMNRCPKIEFGRLSGEIGWLGVNTQVIDNRRQQHDPDQPNLTKTPLRSK